MEIVTQIITGIVIGIVALGLLCFLFRHIFNRLDLKVDKDVFKEYTRRIADSLETGKKRFDKVDENISEQTVAINNMAIEMKGFSVNLQALIEKIK